MTNRNLAQAREWAKKSESDPKYVPEIQVSAIEVIESLPDQWVDVEKLQEVLAEMENELTEPAEGDDEEGINKATLFWKKRLETILFPKLPTLAELIETDDSYRKKCRWMQCKLQDSDDEFVLLHAEWPDFARLLHRSTGTMWDVEMKKVTPLSDLPKLDWPSSTPIDTAPF